MIVGKKTVEELNDTISKLKEGIDRIEKNADEFLDKNQQNRELLTNVGKRISQLEDKQVFLSDKFNQEMVKISKLSEMLEKRVNSFKALEDKASKKIMEDTREEIRSQISLLFRTTEAYKQLETEIVDTQRRIKGVGEEIVRFNAISGKIKDMDFQLADYTDKVSKIDEERLRLHRENDRLKLIISKERRKRY